MSLHGHMSTTNRVAARINRTGISVPYQTGDQRRGGIRERDLDYLSRSSRENSMRWISSRSGHTSKTPSAANAIGSRGRDRGRFVAGLDLGHEQLVIALDEIIRPQLELARLAVHERCPRHTEPLAHSGA